MTYNLKLKDIPSTERPVEKLLKYGPDKLSNSELLAIILRTGIKGENILTLSNRIIAEFNGLEGLLNVGIGEITSIKGIKESKGSQILALVELAKRINSLNRSNNQKVTSPKDIAEMLMAEMKFLKQEVLKLVMLNTKNIVISIKDIFIGSLNTAVIHPREIYKEAIKNSSASIIICHNHPSGDPTPSKEDVDSTIRLKESGKIIGIDLLDHIIVGNNKYISLKEKGII